jgi:hypothetical protein
MNISSRNSLLGIALALAITVSGGAASANAVGSPTPSPGTTTYSAVISAARAVKFDHTPLKPMRRAAIVAAALRHAIVGGGAALNGAPSIAVETTGTTIVTWSLSGTGLDPASALSVVLTKSDGFEGEQQLDFTRDTDGGGVIQAWVGAVFAGARTVTAAQITQAESSALGGPVRADVTAACSTALAHLAVVLVTYGLGCVFGGPAVCVALAAMVVAAVALVVTACATQPL